MLSASLFINITVGGSVDWEKVDAHSVDNPIMVLKNALPVFNLMGTRGSRYIFYLSFNSY